MNVTKEIPDLPYEEPIFPQEISESPNPVEPEPSNIPEPESTEVPESKNHFIHRICG